MGNINNIKKINDDSSEKNEKFPRGDYLDILVLGNEFDYCPCCFSPGRVFTEAICELKEKLNISCEEAELMLASKLVSIGKNPLDKNSCIKYSEAGEAEFEKSFDKAARTRY